MWLMTTVGFFSCVQDRENPNTILVRARKVEHLERFLDLIGVDHKGIVENDGSDYRFRVFLERPSFVLAITRMVYRLDYPNFKNAVKERLPEEIVYRDCLGSVWWELQDLDRHRSRRTSPGFCGRCDGCGEYHDNLEPTEVEDEEDYDNFPVRDLCPECRGKLGEEVD
jgi:hypothetical protein